MAIKCRLFPYLVPSNACEFAVGNWDRLAVGAGYQGTCLSRRYRRPVTKIRKYRQRSVTLPVPTKCCSLIHLLRPKPSHEPYRFPVKLSEDSPSTALAHASAILQRHGNGR